MFRQTSIFYFWTPCSSYAVRCGAVRCGTQSPPPPSLPLRMRVTCGSRIRLDLCNRVPVRSSSSSGMLLLLHAYYVWCYDIELTGQLGPVHNAILNCLCVHNSLNQKKSEHHRKHIRKASNSVHMCTMRRYGVQCTTCQRLQIRSTIDEMKVGTPGAIATIVYLYQVDAGKTSSKSYQKYDMIDQNLVLYWHQ